MILKISLNIVEIGSLKIIKNHWFLYEKRCGNPDIWWMVYNAGHIPDLYNPFVPDFPEDLLSKQKKV
jgi:hypothetical protein